MIEKTNLNDLLLNNKHNMYHIKPFLRKKGFNLSSLATAMDMSFQRFDHHIRPKDDLSYNFILKLAKKINISTDEFIDNIKTTPTNDDVIK